MRVAARSRWQNKDIRRKYANADSYFAFTRAADDAAIQAVDVG